MTINTKPSADSNDTTPFQGISPIFDTRSSRQGFAKIDTE
jgi:hypothetical protein